MTMSHMWFCKESPSPPDLMDRCKNLLHIWRWFELVLCVALLNLKRIGFSLNYLFCCIGVSLGEIEANNKRKELWDLRLFHEKKMRSLI